MSEHKFWAFISYSSKDNRMGSWLHKRLENYSIPADFQGIEVFDGAIIGKNLRPIFRDRDELAGSADLGKAINSALEASRFLIVLCSKNSAKSKWVNKEIESFKAMGKGKNILALILEGEPNATSNGNPENECFPPALQYPAEPIAGDLRKEGDGKERGFLKILAGITQMDFDKLFRRHERLQARRRLIFGVTAILLMALFGGLAGFALIQRNLAEENAYMADIARKEAEANARTAKENEDLALLNKQEAEENALIASKNESKAQKAREEAENNEKMALIAQNEAETQKELAEKLLRNVEEQKQLTEEQLIETRHNMGLVMYSRSLQAIEQKLFNDARLYILHSLDLLRADSYEIIDLLLSKLNFLPEFKLVGGYNLSSFSDNLVTSYSPEWDLLAFGHDSGEISLISVASGEFKTMLKGVNSPCDSLAISPGGVLLASGHEDGEIHLWDLISHEIILSFTGHKKAIGEIEFSPDGETLVSSSYDNTTRFWDVNSGKQKSEYNRIFAPSVSNFSSDGESVAINGLVEGIISIIDVNSEKIETVYFNDSSIIHDVTFSTNGLLLAFTLDDKTIRLWDVKNGKENVSIRDFSSIASRIIFSPDNQVLASGHDDGSIFLWNTSTGEKIAAINRHSSAISNLSFSADGAYLISADRNSLLCIWDLSSMDKGFILRGHEANVESVSISSKGNTIASTGLDGKIRIWDVLTRRERAILDEHPHSLAFSHSGEVLAFDVPWSHDIHLWDANTGEEITVLSGHSSYMTKLLFSSDGRTLTSSSLDGTTRIWNVEQSEEIALHKGTMESKSSISPDKNIVAFGHQDGTVLLYNLAKKEYSEIPNGHEDAVKSVAFSPDGKYLASSSSDSTIRLWDSVTRKEHAVLHGHKFSVNSISFSSDGEVLVSGGADDTIRLWDLSLFNCHNYSQLISMAENDFGLDMDGIALVPSIEEEDLIINPPRWPRNNPYHWKNQAERGDINAMFEMGIIYHRLRKDKLAEEWYVKALEAGHPEAEQRLFVLNQIIDAEK